MKAFRFGKDEVRSSLKVFAWSFGSALVVLAIDFLSALEVPMEFAFLVPLANVLLYSVKEFVVDNS